MPTYIAVPKPRPGDAERFLTYIEKDASSCWIWIGGRAGKKWQDEERAYPVFTINGRNFRAHRVSFSWFKGEVPPVDLHHTCERSLCVNPDHLKPAEATDPHHRNPDQNRCARGHEFTPENTAYSREGWRRCKQCARDKSARYREANHDRVLARRRETREHVTHEPRVCARPGCGELFVPVRSTRLYCSNSCLQREGRRRRKG